MCVNLQNIETSTRNWSQSVCLQAVLELQGTEMIFQPSLEFGVPDGFYDLVDGLVGDIYKQASLIKRLAAHSGQVV